MSLSETRRRFLEDVGEKYLKFVGKRCHCNRPAMGHIDDMCIDCSWARCDAYPGDCPREAV